MIKKRLGIACVLLGLIFLLGAGMAEESATPLSNLSSVARDEVAVAAQWREPAVPGAGGDTLEVFLSNMSSNPLVFSSSVATPLSRGVRSSDADQMGVRSNLIWAQFYPTSNAVPGETIVCRLCFEKAPVPGREKGLSVVIGTAGSATLRVPIPPFRAPEKPITAIAYSLDYGKIFIQCRSPNASLRKCWINGREVADYTCLQSAESGSPMVVACKPPLPLKTGDPVFVRLQFKDGREGRALTRALAGIVLDAFSIPGKERTNVVARLALDEDPPWRSSAAPPGTAIRPATTAAPRGAARRRRAW